MLLRLIILFSIFSFSLSAQRKIQVTENKLSVFPTDEPKDGAEYTYLWWFGDGGYRISTKDNIQHLYSKDREGLINPNSCRTVLITTEHYGTEGDPDLIYADVIASEENSSFKFSRILDSNDPIDFVRINHYRDAVPGDTIYIVITYGFPLAASFDSKYSVSLELDFEDEGLVPDEFEYVGSEALSKSFLPFGETIKVRTQANGSDALVQVDSYGLSLGDERSVLLPFRYKGDKVKGDIKCNVLFSCYEGERDAKLVEERKFEHTLKYAPSHDPNRMDVSAEEVDCNIGGEVLEYNVHFENIGDGPTKYVRIELELSEAHDLSTLEITKLPRWFEKISKSNVQGSLTEKEKVAFYEINEKDHKVTVEFHNLFLTGLLDTLKNDRNFGKDFIEFRLKLKENYVGEESITAFANIFFDENEPVKTNEAITSCTRSNEIESNKNWLIWIGFGVLIIIVILVWLRMRSRKEVEPN